VPVTRCFTTSGSYCKPFGDLEVYSLTFLLDEALADVANGVQVLSTSVCWPCRCRATYGAGRALLTSLSTPSKCVASNDGPFLSFASYSRIWLLLVATKGRPRSRSRFALVRTRAGEFCISTQSVELGWNPRVMSLNLFGICYFDCSFQVCKCSLSSFPSSLFFVETADITARPSHRSERLHPNKARERHNEP
jgi:hypothetical protein